MNEEKSIKHTPLMEQYHEIRAAYPDTLLLFQVGDFYELFFDDAKKAAAFLGITLTARGKSENTAIPLCGFPVHNKDHYIAKLVKGGFHVALCDQLTAPKPGTVVQRGVTQVFTPGTLVDTQLLDAKTASYLCSFFPLADKWGLLFGELLTAQLYATVINAGDNRTLDAQLARFVPDEIVVPSTKIARSLQPFFTRAGYIVTSIDGGVSSEDQASTSTSTESTSAEGAQWLRAQFDDVMVATIEKQESLKLALYTFYVYVDRNQPAALAQFRSINIYKGDDFLFLDQATQRNLELIKDSNGTDKNTLFATIDSATTAMGSRMIKKWLQRPLVNQKPIMQRFDVIDLFIKHIVLIQQLSDLLAQVGDIERVIGRIALRKASFSDYLLLKYALALIPQIKELLYPYTHCVMVALIYEHIVDFSALFFLLQSALNDDASKDWLIKEGFDSSLDRLRDTIGTSNQKLLVMEQAEQEATGINSLKIRYNQVHGYYIEVTKTHMHLIPAHYIRQQTLVGRERYLTPALQQLQYEIIYARAEIQQTEKAVFDRVKVTMMTYVQSLRKLAHSLAHLDALLAFAHNASAYNYVRPIFNEQRTITIKEGRHPVVERMQERVFIANDTEIDDTQSLWIITGPNMGGKSTYLRQVALIQILAQSGSFVPASYAHVALVDRIFTRIGAGDKVAEGKSTFLVEMEETAVICKEATEKSLVILDEVGRGTSTFDGLAIAQAVVEYIFNKVGARCLFATHYHELALLQDTMPGVVSYHAMSKKTSHGIVFLYKMGRGIADGSFGVEVAKLAHLPGEVIDRAQALLILLSTQHIDVKTLMSGVTHDSGIDRQENIRLKTEVQRLGALVDKYAAVTAIDFDQLSPKKAFDILWHLKEGL